MTPTEIESHAYLSVAEVARYARIGKHHVYGAIESGDLRALKVSSRLFRIATAEAKRWLESLADTSAGRN